MGRRMILDTNVLIAYERETIARSSLDEDELAIASISVAEYRVGIELADSPVRAAERARALATIISVIDVLDYTGVTAAHHGRLLAHVRKSDTRRGAHDLIIAVSSPPRLTRTWRPAAVTSARCPTASPARTSSGSSGVTALVA